MKKDKSLSVDFFLKMIEKYLSINLPKTYRNFLENYEAIDVINEKKVFILNNKTKESSSVDGFFYLTNDYNYSILENYKIYKDRIPENFFPIADDPFGNLILISVKNADRDKIYFWDHEMEVDDGETPDYSNLTLIADSFDEFIEGLYSIDEISDDI